MSTLAIVTIVLCLLSFFSIFIIWICHAIGKLTIINEKYLDKIFTGVVVVIMAVSGSFIYHVFSQYQYNSRPYLGMFSENRAIQTELRRFNKYKGEIDGIIGNGTLSSFQKYISETDSELVPSGINEESLEVLFRNREEKPFDYKHYSERILRIKKLFADAGIISESGVNGNLDEEFLEAVGMFQSDSGIRYDQDFGPDTLLRVVEYELNKFKSFKNGS